ncbi:MAG: hypothetical protein J6J36_04315 [Clostridia bacterium]|nr:hypothetical protein [Clostridia bacterium]
MEKMRNMIRIKDVPSNTIEEAIIILKQNKRAKKFESLNKFKNIDSDVSEENNYVIKEAELIISDYLKSTENKKDKHPSKKIKRLKIANCGLIIALIVSIIF